MHSLPNLFLSVALLTLAVGCEDFYSQSSERKGDLGTVKADLASTSPVDLSSKDIATTPVDMNEWGRSYSIDPINMQVSGEKYSLAAFQSGPMPNLDMRVYYLNFNNSIYITRGTLSIPVKALKEVQKGGMIGHIISFVKTNVLLVYGGTILPANDMAGIGKAIDINFFMLKADDADIHITPCQIEQTRRIPATDDTKELRSLILSSDSRFLIVELCEKVPPAGQTVISCVTRQYSIDTLIGQTTCGTEY